MKPSAQELSPAQTGIPSGEILSSEQIDASCRWPIFSFFISAAFWFLVSNILGLLVSIKLHSPNFLARCSWLTYGRLRPAQLDTLVYGFAASAAFGVMLWLFCRLGRNRLAAPGIILVAAKIWNIGVLVGAIGILAGDSTGFEWLEFPRYAVFILFIAYALIGIWALFAFHSRKQKQLFPSQWYLLAALFWFAWIYSAANMLLVFAPVRGVVQLCVSAWFTSNLFNVWLSLVGLGTIFYFIPKLTGRPLHSYYLALFAFWSLALFGGWGFININAPLPSWIPAISAVMAMMMILPILAVAFNVRRTIAGYRSPACSPILTLTIFGAWSFVFAQLMNVIGAIRPINEVLAFTYYFPAQNHWLLLGFFASAMFAAIYYILPLVLNVEPTAPSKIRAQSLVLFAGVIIYGAALTIGGIVQGINLSNSKLAFADVIKGTFPFLFASTTGSLLLVIAGFMLISNLLSLGCRAGCGCWKKSQKSEARS
jgi:cytochrome c oxidase cbb3-type subunit 1